jgi:phospholipid-binding lipoprotein MlaA
LIRLAFFALVALVASGCASTPADQRAEHDPWENLNRGLYKFNDTVDRVTLKPIAKGYEKVIPAPVRRSVTNFSRNLATPGSALNSFLQGKGTDGMSELSRFLVNSTFGIAGLFDVARHAGLEPKREDFGQTAAVWGIPSGPYVVVPFLGPRTLRGALTQPLDVFVDPLYHYDDSSVRTKVWALRLIDLRARVLPLEDLVQDSNDPYVSVRESYLQNREFEIYDGDPPMDDDDDFYDEFLDEEDY